MNMSEYVSESVAKDFVENGKLIGRTEPTRESKYTWWEVYEKADEIVACVFSDMGCSEAKRSTAQSYICTLKMNKYL
jgi:hypothetical protein